jgi:hypothetical protein
VCEVERRVPETVRLRLVTVPAPQKSEEKV